MKLREMELRRVPVSAVMTRGPATVEETAPVADAAAEMVAGGFRHVPVVDGEGRLVGMISDRDVRARLGADVHGFASAAADVLAQPVTEAMTPDPIALPPTASLAQALEVFADERVGAIPITDDGDRPVGIVSYLDLLGLIRELSEQAARRDARAARPPRRAHPAARLEKKVHRAAAHRARHLHH